MPCDVVKHSPVLSLGTMANHHGQCGLPLPGGHVVQWANIPFDALDTFYMGGVNVMPVAGPLFFNPNCFSCCVAFLVGRLYTVHVAPMMLPVPYACWPGGAGPLLEICILRGVSPPHIPHVRSLAVPGALTLVGTGANFTHTYKVGSPCLCFLLLFSSLFSFSCQGNGAVALGRQVNVTLQYITLGNHVTFFALVFILECIPSYSRMIVGCRAFGQLLRASPPSRSDGILHRCAFRWSCDFDLCRSHLPISAACRWRRRKKESSRCYSCLLLALFLLPCV